MKTLWDLKEKNHAVIKELDMAMIPNQHQRLKELGIRHGETIVCLKIPPFGGPRVYQICGSLFSIAKDVAFQISIEDEEPLPSLSLAVNV